MSRFNFDITYVKGELNKVADCLSRYFESNTPDDVYDPYAYVRADVRIDPEGDDLPLPRYQEVKERVVELRAMRAEELRRSRRLHNRVEQRDREAQEMQDGVESSSTSSSHATRRDEVTQGDDITLGDALFNSEGLPRPIPDETQEEFLLRIKGG
ncbi:hypothetical protein H0H92_016067, partial [Tricholoma furcatifolium]